MTSPVQLGFNAFPFTLPTSPVGDNIPDVLEQLLTVITQQTLASSDLYAVMGNSTDPTKQVLFAISAASANKATTLAFAHTSNRTITFPDATDTLAGIAATQTLTNKTLTSPILTTPSLTDGTTVGVGSVSGSVIGNASSKLGFFGLASAVAFQNVSANAAVVTTAVTTAAGFYGFATAAQGNAVVTLLNAVRLALTNYNL